MIDLWALLMKFNQWLTSSHTHWRGMMTVQLLIAQHSPLGPRLSRQVFMQDGDVSTYDISQASGCGRNLVTGSSGPLCNMSQCIFKKIWALLSQVFHK